MKSLQEQVARVSAEMSISGSEAAEAPVQAETEVVAAETASAPAKSEPQASVISKPSLSGGLLEAIEKIDAAEAQAEQAKKSAEESREFLEVADAAIPRLLEKLYAHGKDSPLGKDAKRLLTKEVLQKKGLPAEIQRRIHVLHVKHVVAKAIEHDGVPGFDEVMKLLADYGLAAEVTEPKSHPKPHYHIGDKVFAFLVPGDMRAVVERDIIGGLNKLRPVTAEREEQEKERAKQERKDQRVAFEQDVSLTMREVFDGRVGTGIIHVPFRRVPNKKMSQGWLPVPGGLLKVNSDGSEVVVVDATGSPKFADSMNEVRMASAVVSLPDVFGNERLNFGFFNSKKRRMDDHERKMTNWLHGALRAAWEQLEAAADAEEKTTISVEQFFFGKKGIALPVLQRFYHAKNEGERPKHYANLWVLVERDEDGQIRVLEHDKYAYELFSQAAMQAAYPGENFEKLDPALRNFLRVVAGQTKRELTPERMEDLRQFAEAEKSGEPADFASAAGYTPDDELGMDDVEAIGEQVAAESVSIDE